MKQLLIVIFTVIWMVSAGEDTSTICNGNNEQYSECASICPRTCSSLNDVTCEACEPGCECKPQFVLEEIDGPCIPISECKK